MSADIKSVVLETTHISKNFSLQLDESMEISWPAQLFANVCFVAGDTTKKNCLSCKAWPDKNNRGVNVLGHIGISWKKRIKVGNMREWWSCSHDGTYQVKERNPDVIFTHCFLLLAHFSAKWVVCKDGLHGRYSHHYLNALNARMQGWNENLPTSPDQRNGSSNMWQLERFPLTKKWQDVDTATLS